MKHISKLRIHMAVVFALLLSLSLSAVQSLPASLSDAEFWRLIESISEPSGPFISDNLISNEVGYGATLPALRTALQPNGAYVGVGPEQNFTYIAALKPKIAFVVDIRRDNMLQHLLYKALFELSENREQFVSRLFSRRFTKEVSEKTIDVLKKHGFPVTYEESTGGHTWINWRNYLNVFAPQLFQ
jgi:hypothetical protein